MSVLVAVTRYLAAKSFRRRALGAALRPQGDALATHRRPKFYMSDRVEVFVCGGTGLVGSALVTQLRANAASRANIKLVGFCSSTKIIACEGEQKESVVRESADRRVPSDDEIMQCCSSPNATVCVVDATSSEDVSALYAPWLERRWHVVTCNKKVNSGNLEYYTRCMDATKNGGGKWFVEATIGAGLPIVSTLRTLVATGDEIESVQGIFSGTMSFLFNTWDGESAFSETVALAKAAGYTEPDPREDLNGLDVARKVVIAARECGVALSLDDVVVQSMVPSELASCSADEFLERYAENDAAMAQAAANASKKGCVLRFVGHVDVKARSASVRLVEFAKAHPFATLSGADNIFEIKTARYGPTGGSTPLIVRGPGAGAAVTAAGVFGDIVGLAKNLSLA
jgi:aspartokinase/homoserine dehydrogenase 1